MIKDDYKNLFQKIKPSRELETATITKMKNIQHRTNGRRVKKTFAVIAVSLAAAVSVSCVAYAASPAFKRFVKQILGEELHIDPDKVVCVEGLPQYPAEGFSLLENVGKRLSAEGLSFEGFDPSYLRLYEISSAEKIAYKNGEIIVLSDDGKGFSLKKNQTAVIDIMPDSSAEYSDWDYGEYISVGYIVDNTMYEIPTDKLKTGGLSLEIPAERDGEYRYFIINCSAGMQNLSSVSVRVTEKYRDFDEWKAELEAAEVKYTLDVPVKPVSIEISPTELSWTQPYMNGVVAEMMMTGLRYSPEEIEIDLRMLNECAVRTVINSESIGYMNNVLMFNDKGNDSNRFDCGDMNDEFIPLKLKMADGTIKNVCFTHVDTGLSAVMPDEWKPETLDEMLEPTANIPSDYPAPVTFHLHELIDYSNVAAIVFCGYEVPITEREFEPIEEQ